MEQHARTWEESPNIAKWRRKQGVNRQYTDDFDALFIITGYGINLYLYSGFFRGQVESLGYSTKGRAFGPRASLDRWRQLAWQATSYKYG